MVRDYSKPVSDESLYNTKKALEKNGFSVFLADDLKAARTAVLNLVPDGSEVFTATSVTLDKAGLNDELNGPTYVSIRDKIVLQNTQDSLAKRRIGSVSEYTVGSVHAITEDGQAVIASASGSQLPNYVYGAGVVIWVVGTQKIVKDLEEAFDRVENYTLPLEDERAKQAYGVGSVISKLLIYKSDPQQRVIVILVKEAVGF